MPRLTAPVTQTDHRIGKFESPVTLVEYGDYECSTCQITVPIMKQLKKELGDKLCFVYRHFPFKQIHPFAMAAAKAAEAASLQNKFWEMHELLYQNQSSLKPELFLQLATELNLNLDQFEKDIKSDSIAKKIEADFDAGFRSGVNGTPCFYINEERYDGDPSYSTLKKTLQLKLLNSD